MITKDEFIDLAAEMGAVYKYELRDSMPAFCDTLVDLIEKGETLRIHGIGTIGVRKAPPRVARDPRDLSEMRLPSKYVVFFKPGQRLKDAADRYNESLKEDDE